MVIYLNKEISEYLGDREKDWLSVKPNVGLFFQKYFRCKFTEEDKFNWKLAIKNLNELFSNRSNNNVYHRIFHSELYKNFFNRYKDYLNNLSVNSYISIKMFELSLVWRLLINLGTEDTKEAAILLDRNYSFPYIPGSAIKGLLKFYIKDIMKNYLKIIFGNDEQSGKFLFFDAYPIPNSNANKDFIVLDVMTPHYQRYYNDQNKIYPPGDWDDPIPIFFPAIQNLDFKFFIGYSKKKTEGIDFDTLSEDVIKNLKKALKEYGIGAKTSSGYGFFKKIKD